MSAPRVLVADPQPAARASVRRLLEGSGFEICAEAADATAAVEAAMREKPDICVIDVLLPGDGIETVSKITREAPGVAVLMLTASKERDHLFDSVRAGAAGYLIKSMDPDRLAHAIWGVLNGEAAIPRDLVASLIGELRSQGMRRSVAGRDGRAELTRREWEVARLLVDGLDTAAIAERLYLAPATVRRHISSLVRKLGVDDREAAIALLTELDA